jgi:hypothetical protein
MEDDQASTITPQLSIGVQKGFAVENKAITDIWNDPAAVSLSRTSNPAFLIEPSLQLSTQINDRVSFIFGPAFMFAQNTEEIKVNYNDGVGNTGSIDDTATFSVYGGKIYIGMGIRLNNHVTMEILPFFGYSSIKETGAQKIVVNGINLPDKTYDASGSAAIYGGTVGAHWKFNKGLIIGARIGYTGQTVKLDDYNYNAQGVLAAVDAGWCF